MRGAAEHVQARPDRSLSLFRPREISLRFWQDKRRRDTRRDTFDRMMEEISVVESRTAAPSDAAGESARCDGRARGRRASIGLAYLASGGGELVVPGSLWTPGASPLSSRSCGSSGAVGTSAPDSPAPAPLDS
jgi:hypothetical protein